jgi:hypothetical protein
VVVVMGMKVVEMTVVVVVVGPSFHPSLHFLPSLHFTPFTSLHSLSVPFLSLDFPFPFLSLLTSVPSFLYH